MTAGPRSLLRWNSEEHFHIKASAVCPPSTCPASQSSGLPDRHLLTTRLWCFPGTTSLVTRFLPLRELQRGDFLLNSLKLILFLWDLSYIFTKEGTTAAASKQSFKRVIRLGTARGTTMRLYLPHSLTSREINPNGKKR